MKRELRKQLTMQTAEFLLKFVDKNSHTRYALTGLWSYYRVYSQTDAVMPNGKCDVIGLSLRNKRTVFTDLQKLYLSRDLIFLSHRGSPRPVANVPKLCQTIIENIPLFVV